MGQEIIEQGREPLDCWQRGRVLEEYPSCGPRLDALSGHTREELGDYVHSLAIGIPPGESMTRRELYYWTPVPPEHYHGWGKKELIRRIICMEEHDDLRLNGELPEYRRSPPVKASTQPLPKEYLKVQPREDTNE